MKNNDAEELTAYVFFPGFEVRIMDSLSLTQSI
jgi:hypothetical protein